MRSLGFALALLLAGPAAAQGVPEALRGAWFAGDCADPAAMLVLTGRAAARVDAEAPARLYRFATLGSAAGYALGTGTGPEAPRLMFRAAAEGLETIEPEAKTRDDRLPGDAAPQAWRRCDSPPAALAALHGEGIAFLAALENLEAACGTGTPGACAEAILRQGDVSGDARLSPAELARLARGAAWLLAVQEGATQEVLATAVGAGALGGILAARTLVESLDYDGDGRLSAAELLQDRGPGFARAAGTPEGRPLRMEGLSEGAGMLRSLMDGLLNR
ncbi:hypothetical protein [Falsiroseomonas sp. HW251]|uniref:hypothetical protein n=1 Tax=Falsiroseomonas sp. HW251 TaxID=3390998 RepID=UPI003D311139